MAKNPIGQWQAVITRLWQTTSKANANPGSAKNFFYNFTSFPSLRQPLGKYQSHNRWQMNIECNRCLFQLALLSHLKYDIDEELNLSSDYLRTSQIGTVFFQAYAENCTPVHAICLLTHNATLNDMQSIALPRGDVVDLGLTERAGLGSRHARIGHGCVYTGCPVHNLWKLGVQEADQMFVHLFKL